LGGGVGFDVEEELIFPGPAVDGAAFDFLKVDAVFGERFERGEERAGAVSEAHGDRHFVRVGRRRLRFVGGAKEDEPGEIFSVVLDVGGEDDAAVVFGGAATGDGCVGFVAAGKSLAHAAGSVFGGNALEVRMRREETFALSESHGMTRDRTNRVQSRAGAADQVVLDGENGLRSDGEGALQEQVVDTHDWPREGVFYWSEKSVSEAVADGAEGGVEGGTGDGGDGFAEELDSGFFAEGARLALESYAHFKDDSTPQHGHRGRRFLSCPGCGSDPDWLGLRKWVIAEARLRRGKARYTARRETENEIG
jgi:hypothetical protein